MEVPKTHSISTSALILSILLVVLLNACISVQFKAPPLKQSFSSYFIESKETNKDLYIQDEFDLCNLKNNQPPRVYLTNGIEVKNCLYRNTNSLIYMWKPRCTSVNCLSLNIVQTFCNEQGISLFTVAQYYDNENMSVNYEIDRPILGIDPYHYETDFQKKYIKKFISDLIGKETEIKKCNFIFFEKDQFVRCFNQADSLFGYFE